MRFQSDNLLLTDAAAPAFKIGHEGGDTEEWGKKEEFRKKKMEKMNEVPQPRPALGNRLYSRKASQEDGVTQSSILAEPRRCF
ncbi:hypothetical protein EON64_08430 [archaeon]|nr:MAG: hypothetical protein EON64_08430 [archaeon]